MGFDADGPRFRLLRHSLVRDVEGIFLDAGFPDRPWRVVDRVRKQNARPRLTVARRQRLAFPIQLEPEPTITTAVLEL